MMLIKNIVTLDRLESSDYIYKLVSDILPSLCLDYKVDKRLVQGYVHPLDIIQSPELQQIVSKEERSMYLDTIGINYILSRRNDLAGFFPVIMESGSITPNWNNKLEYKSNYISCSVTFNEMPTFTKLLLKIRTTSFEGHARYFGGYVKHPSSFDVLSPFTHPDISFNNFYINSLLYPHVIGSSSISTYKAITVNDVMVKKDLINLLNVRALLDQTSRTTFDIIFKIQQQANANNLVYTQNPIVDTDLATMSYKYLVMYFQHFSNFTLREMYMGGVPIVITLPMLATIAVSSYFQREIEYVENNKLLKLNYQDIFEFRTVNSNTYIRYTDQQLGLKLLSMYTNVTYIINALNIVSKSIDKPRNVPKQLSLFWDGMSYEEYKNLSFTDMMFLGSTCYLMALYNKNNITYCSMLSDALQVGETPLRVCVLPRIIKGKTVPSLITEILNNINNMSVRDFPKYDSKDVKHIGLSDNGFMLFFQLLRLMENKEPHVAVKEILMAYTGIKMEDNGSPYYISPESYRTFVFLLFKAMGFSVRVNRTVVSSHTYTSYVIRPVVTKRYLMSMLQKATCSDREAEKLLSSAHDLISFMMSVNNSNRDGYRRMNKYFYGGNKNTEDATLVQFITPVNILDRINVKGILSATALNEILDTDVFLPENITFKNNIKKLLENDYIDGKLVSHIIPLNIIDKLVTSGGAGIAVRDLLDNIEDTNSDSTDEVIDLITNALKDNQVKDSSCLATNILNSLIPLSEKQMDGIKKVTCQGTMMFKELAMHIYFIERYFKGKIADEVKNSILEKYKDFIELSKSLYNDLIAIDQIKSVLTIIRRTGKNVDDSPITQEDLQKAYTIAKPKIIRLVNYYTEMSKSYFENIKKIINPDDDNGVFFDNE